MIKYFLLLSTLISFSCFGQFHRKDNERLLILSPGFSYQGQWFGELNLMLSKYLVEHSGVVIWGPRIGIETNFRSNNFIYAPKIGYEVAGFPIDLKANAITYIDNGRVDLRILPEIGLSFFGLVNLTYGYSIPTLTFRTFEISRHRVALTLNLDFDILEEL